MFTEKQMQNTIEFILFAGIILSLLLVMLGGLTYLYHDGAAPIRLEWQLAELPPSAFQHPWQTALSLTPDGIILLGLLLLIATQTIRVALLVCFFTAIKDYKFSIISAFVLFILIYSSLSPAHAAAPNTDSQKSFLGPYLRGGYTAHTAQLGAYSIAAEAGIHNVRLNGTLGWSIMDDQRLKISGEFTTQEITYAFFSGNTSQWVHQGAIGADYQYDFNPYSFLFSPQFDFNAYASHAPSDGLRKNVGSYINALGSTVNYVDAKRIAGSNAAGASPGMNFALWEGMRTGLSLNYDNVRYDTAYSSQTAKGLGGTARVSQALSDMVKIGFSAAVRQPFNEYEANITWFNLPYFGLWTIGVNGDYTIGKHALPTTYNIGLSADFLLDKSKSTAQSDKEEAYSFLNWVAKPAVHMPQYIGIPEDLVTTS